MVFSQEFLYPLGFISSLFFALRTLGQWGYSEINGKSSVPKIFWQLSLVGNLTLLFHSLLQRQFHVATFQVINAIISFRNLDLMKKNLLSFNKTLILFILSEMALIVFFLNQKHLFQGPEEWFRTPLQNLEENGFKFFALHLIGFFGLFLFNSRFWVQWWQAETLKKSFLNKTFWQISLFGDLLCAFYFTFILDPVNAIGPIANLIPITRNLILIKKEEGNI